MSSGDAAAVPSAQPIGDLFSEFARTRAESLAITCGPDTVSYGQLDRTANRLARAYAQLGVSEGDFVTVGLPNGIEFFEACVAIWKLGAVPQPVSFRVPDRELQRLVELVDPGLVIGFPRGRLAGRAPVDAGFRPDESLSDAPLPSRVSPAWKAITSGGSTGAPKLIVAGRSGLIDPSTLGVSFRLRSDQVQLVSGPLHHNFSFFLSMAGLMRGQRLIVLPRFDPEAALAAIDRYAVNFVSFVPTMMLRMLRVLEAQPGAYRLDSIEVLWHTGAPCPAWLKERWLELISPERVLEAYGGTEGQAATVIDGADWLQHRGSVGRVVLGEIRVVRADGADAPAGESGDLLVRGPAGAAPAYRYVGANAKTYGDGWETLGDVGYLDADGYLYLGDRKLDMVLVGGANVYPAEVEAALSEHPQVLSSVIVGVPDEEMGERVHAVVQIEGELRETELLEFLTERLVSYKLPRSFHFVDEPLRDDAGKVRRTAVRAQELELMGTKESV
jgi:bile acid-coenzyme A ligase